VVVNTAARSNLVVQKYGQTLDCSLEELGSRLVALWVINRQRDSVGLLKQFMEAIPMAEVHVVRNGYFGAEQKFELYNGSKVRESVESRGGRSITLPDLADRVADDIYVNRLTIGGAAKSLPIGNRAELGHGAGRSARSLPGSFREPRGVVCEGARRGRSVSVEEAFAKVVDRQASEEERTRLYRLRDALGLRDNDAFWCIVMALEHYDAFFRQYSAQLAEQTAHAIEGARAAFAVAAA
jgi:hypothetical protein